MTRQIFAVTRTRGAGWDETRPLEEQADWRRHADFMNGLHKDGFVLLGGLLEGTPDVLLIIRADDEAEIRSRLAEDCWSRSDLLRIAGVVPWTLRLGSLG